MGNWGEKTLLIGVITSFVTGRGPPCLCLKDAWDEMSPFSLRRDCLKKTGRVISLFLGLDRREANRFVD